MSWICDSCGYENEYNDNTKPTECACCGELASQMKIIQAIQELDNLHREQERQAKLEHMRQLAIRYQKRIQLIINKLSHMVKYGARSCGVCLILSVGLLGYSCFKGEISIDNIVKNTGNIVLINRLNIMVENTESEITSDINYLKSICLNTSLLNRDITHFNNNSKYLAFENKDRLQNSISNIQTIQQQFSSENNNILTNASVSVMNVTQGSGNICNNLNNCKDIAVYNLEKLIRYISNKTKE